MFDEVKELLERKINTPFDANSERGRKRKIILWYDANKEYEDFINEFTYDNTEVIKYDNNSIWIRYHIEKEELNKNIIIYLPFARPIVEDNNLLDLETENEDLIFNPDSTSIILSDLGLSEDCRNSIKKVSKFFNNKKRKDTFLSFDVEKNKDTIDKIVLACLLGLKTIKTDEIIKALIYDYYFDKKKLDDVFKFSNEDYIIELLNNEFGSKITRTDDFEKLFKSLVFTYFATNLDDVDKISKYGNYILKTKSTNVYVFVNNMMRDSETKKCFEKISEDLVNELDIKNLLKEKMTIDDYKYSDAFECIDTNIIEYIVNQLVNQVNNYDDFEKIILIRESKYWYPTKEKEYNFLKMYISFMKSIDKVSEIKMEDIDTFTKKYASDLYEIDTLYRKKYYYYDNILDKDIFVKLKDNVEKEYIMNYMSKLSISWSDTIEHLPRYDSNKLVLQDKFYNEYIKQYKDKRERVIVIISDAFRYECANELCNRLKKYASKSEIHYMLGLVPSYTKLGMASLLPHNKLERVIKQDKEDSKKEFTDDILVDGEPSSSISDREKILQKEIPDSMAITYKDLYEKTKMDWKNDFSGKKVIYIYHNTIDNAGEHNEDRLFNACEEAISELEKLIEDLHKTFSGVTVYVTADHGFFYKREKLQSFDKTGRIESSSKQKTRYSYSDNKINEEGILSINLNYLFGDNSGFVNIPKGNMIFARQGIGVNYFHGGILPQEIIIPVIEFKSTRTSEDDSKVTISYSGISNKITDAVTFLEFFQNEKVDENHKPCRYLVHFEDLNGNRVSDETTIIANNTSDEVKTRYFKEKFVFKNITYDKVNPYFLVIIDEATEEIISKTKFFIDIPIITDFKL